MNIGWLGLGKLGMACAVALEQHGGHKLVGYDPDPAVAEALTERRWPHQETGLQELLERTELRLAGSVEEVVAHAEVVFVAVQTPHGPRYDGSVPVPETRRDFEYAYLTQAVRDVCHAAQRLQKHITLAVVSTVLPGTCNRHLRGLLNSYTTLVYNPAFIAMGTAVADFTLPEFVLVGADRPEHAQPLAELYQAVHDRPVHVCSIESAELVKVAYNTFISAKIAVANTLLEIAHHTGADVDEVTSALAQATDRLISPRYLQGGMGDGGACHPRDGIAMSHLAQRLGLSFDLFGALAEGRDAQTRWLAHLAADHADIARLSTIVVLGRAYKPGTALTAGSPATLLTHMLRDIVVYRPVIQWDPHTDGEPPWGDQPPTAVYVVATQHPEFSAWPYPTGSVVIDPWGYAADQPGVTVVHVGRKRP